MVRSCVSCDGICVHWIKHESVDEKAITHYHGSWERAVNHVRMFAIASLPVILHEDENTDDDRNIAAIQRWENLVLNQHRIRQKQRLWSALGQCLLAISASLRARLSKTDRG